MDISSTDSDWFSELMLPGMDDDQDEPSSFIHIMNSISPPLVNHASPSTPLLPEIPSNNNHDDFLLSGMDNISVDQSVLSSNHFSDVSGIPALPRSSTSEVSSSSTSSPPNILCFGNPNSPSNNIIDDPTTAGFTYTNLATMGAIVLGTSTSNTALYPTESRLNRHQHINNGIIKGAIQASAANTAYKRRVKSAIIKPLDAERNRREKLNQHFIALSAQIPGLKKIDRASVLEEATKYLEQLKEKVKTLEEEQKSLKMSMKTTRSSDETTDVVTVNKKLKCGEKQVEHLKNRGNVNYDSDDTNVSEDGFSTSSCEGNSEDEPEIEARVSHNNIFIRIHCKKHQGVLGKVIKEIEKLHLTVLQSSVMPSGSSTLYITVISQMDIEFCLTAKDIVNNLKATMC
ncbi:hypothetical protein MKX01_011089 [Papaver californicum]|nr:hypothetical protein MKX01_011089 [Papaver californicum]